MINKIIIKWKGHFNKRTAIDVAALVIALIFTLVFAMYKSYFGVKIILIIIIPIIIAIIATSFNNNILQGFAVSIYLCSMTYFSFTSGKPKLFLIGGFHALLIIIGILLLIIYYWRKKRVK